MHCDIPPIVRSCVLAITDHGMDMEGKFRVPGPAQHVDDLRKAFEDGKGIFEQMLVFATLASDATKECINARGA